MDRRDMPPARANRIADAIEAIERDVTRLRELRELSLEQYTSDEHRDGRDAVEPKFEKLAEATIDVATQILKQEGEPVPERRKATISAIEDLGVVDSELAEKLRDAVGFRDVLAHMYGPIVADELVYTALQDSLGRYVAFVEVISEYMERFGD